LRLAGELLEVVRFAQPGEFVDIRQVSQAHAVFVSRSMFAQVSRHTKPSVTDLMGCGSVYDYVDM